MVCSEKLIWSRFVLALVVLVLLSNVAWAADPATTGIILSRGNLQIRVTNNTSRFSSLVDGYRSGYNGLASVIDARQKRNIFEPAGMNLECARVYPKSGPLKDSWNAPRLGPMSIQRIGHFAAKLTQKGTDAAGLNVEIKFKLNRNSTIDQTITTWPDHDVNSTLMLFASYMNLVQNTSLFLRGVREARGGLEWLEMVTPGHPSSASGWTFYEFDNYYRPFDPAGKKWHEYLTDNPLLRQGVWDSSASIAATKA
ncbi:MAG: hypothetical protein ACYSTL_06075, partial [Planctomycetota bacterium]